MGASDQPGSLGGRAVALLCKFGYPGDIWPINPGRETVAGLRCYPSLEALPRTPELAILAVAAAGTLDAARQCVAAGVRHGIVWAGGFAETGEEGARLQQELTAICRDGGFTICGPNSLGIVNTWLPLTGTFAARLVNTGTLLRGSISMVSQSGGLGIASQAMAQDDGFGFRCFISCGNEAVLGIADYLAALVEDEATAVIAAYVEGQRDGSALVAALAQARAAGKPVVMLKTGLTAATARAAAAHTGALVGDGRVWSAVLREHGVIQVDTVRELLDVSIFLSSSERVIRPAGRRVAIVSFGGGWGVLCTDLCARHGLEAPLLSAAIRAKLQDMVPPIASIANPIDLTPATFQPRWLARFPEALETIASDPAIDTVFFALNAMATGGREVAEAIVALRGRTGKTICVSWVLAPPEGLAILAAAGVFVFPEQGRALAAVARIAASVEAAGGSGPALAASVPAASSASRPAAGTGHRGEPAHPAAIDWREHVPDPAAGTVVSEDRCHRILQLAGLPVARGRLARSADEALAAARFAGYPVAMKGISAAVTHRADAGLLRLGVGSDAVVAAAYHELAEQARGNGIALDGVYVQQMVRAKAELLISAFRDPAFGVMITCGAGGGLTELIDDVALARAPLDADAAAALLRRSRLVRRTLQREPDSDLSAPAEFVARFSQLVTTIPWRRFVFEINPVRWQAGTAVAVDGLLIIEQP
ncbi:MAG: acetate--CoA ligase family protein [Lautropia sp.]